MKKLLALILCVMMFVSIIPTAAFAAYDTTDQRVWRGKGQIEDIIDALRTNVQLMYGSIAADTAVYQSVKSVDDMINSLADEMIKGYAPTTAGTGQAGSVIKDAVIAGLRSTIGGEVSDYLDKHSNEYYVLDKNGNRILDPSKYAGVFASALSGAVASDKAVAGIQSYMYYILQRSAYEQTAQQLADIGIWGDNLKDINFFSNFRESKQTGYHVIYLDTEKILKQMCQDPLENEIKGQFLVNTVYGEKDEAIYARIFEKING